MEIEVHETTAATLAERALVGALIWEPSRVRDICRWLEPGDFDSWVDGRIYEVINAMTAQQRTDRLVFELPDALSRGLYSSSFGPEPHHAMVDWMLRIHERLRLTPAPAPSPWASPSVPDTGAGPATRGGPRSEHVRYAWYVLEASTRRAVADNGTRIEQLAADVEVDVATMLESLDNAVARLNDLATRLAEVTRTATSTVRERPPPLQAAVDTAPRSTVRRGVGPGHTFTTKQVQRAELETVAGALTFPLLRANLLSRLTPTDFSVTAVGATWAALAVLHQRGDPIDYVTVAWQAERAAASAGTPIPMDHLAKLGIRLADPAEAFRSAELMTRASALRHAAQAGHDLNDVARTPHVDGRDVVASASERVQLARRHLRRLDPDAARARSAPAQAGDGVPSPRQPARGLVNQTPGATPHPASARTATPQAPAPDPHVDGPKRSSR